MTKAIPRIKAVSTKGPGTIAIAWEDGSKSEVDLSAWIETGDDLLAPLRQPSVFARATVGEYGGNVTWDDDEGDLAIDSLHLRRLSDEQRGDRAAA